MNDLAKRTDERLADLDHRVLRAMLLKAQALLTDRMVELEERALDDSSDQDALDKLEATERFLCELIGEEYEGPSDN